MHLLILGSDTKEAALRESRFKEMRHPPYSPDLSPVESVTMMFGLMNGSHKEICLYFKRAVFVSVLSQTGVFMASSRSVLYCLVVPPE